MFSSAGVWFVVGVFFRDKIFNLKSMFVGLLKCFWLNGNLNDKIITPINCPTNECKIYEENNNIDVTRAIKEEQQEPGSFILTDRSV